MKFKKIIKLPAVLYISLTFNALFLILQFIDTGLSIDEKLETKATKEIEKSKSIIAIVEHGDFQNESFDIITVGFSNPTKEPKTIRNILFHCSTRNGKSLVYSTANNTPKGYNLFPKIDLSPFYIKPGESKQINFYVFKESAQENLVKKCSKLKTQWSNSEFNPEFGDEILLEENMVTFTNLVSQRG